MSHVDALGAAYPDPPGQRLVNVTEQGSTRTVAADQREQVLRANLGAPSLHIIE
jgi:hypothetical protein